VSTVPIRAQSAAVVERPVAFADAARGLFDIAYRVAFRVLGERDEAEDVAQEAIIRAGGRWARIHSYAGPWTARVASNLAISAIRGRDRRRSLSPDPDVHHDRDATLRIDLQDALRALGPRERESVMLHYFADLTYEQVGTALGCSEGSVKRYVHRGISRLRDSLGEQWEDLA
jgi:RNA polymerase sigma factor (sigma-70 family)